MAEYADTPWWSNLIAVLVTAVVTGFATVLYMKAGVTSIDAPAGPSGLGGLVKDTLVYIPHALLLFGVIADMLTYQGVYSIASLVGLLSLPIHLLFKFIWQGTFDMIEKVMDILTRTPTPPNSRIAIPTVVGGPNSTVGGAARGSFFTDYDGCDIQGFGWAHSRFAPQSLVVIATVFSYYVFDLIANRGWQNATATILLGAFFYIVQLMLAGDCAAPGEEPIGTLYKGLLAAVEGMFVGGVSYSVVQAYFPQRLPSTAISPFPKMTPADLKDGKFDKDGNPWVCVNGVCYPDMSTDASRKAFAEMAAASTGNGQAAVAANCPAK
jgi:hypothetical protein